MSDSESNFEPASDSPESLYEEPLEKEFQRPSVASFAGRKRRRQSRSSSVESTLTPLENTRDLARGSYKDEYRTLYNENVSRAAARFNPDDLFHRGQKQIGLSIWAPEERSKFFAALEKLGKDDVPAIAKAVGTKTIAEVRQYLLLLEEASTKPGISKVALRDIPAATEISAECISQLDSAGDALAWYQEQYEASREKDEYGDYWLITPEIAEEIDAAHAPSRRSSFASSPPPAIDNADQLETMKEPPAKPKILQVVPEGDLLEVGTMLKLSSTVFMNGSPCPPSWFPHWSTLVSPLAANPSIYRTALIDFHTLAVSLTRRLVQASLVQATSRMRAQDWRTRKGNKAFVRKRDVLTAIDLCRAERNGMGRWRKVARRCGLRVFEGAGKNKREIEWSRVEQIMDVEAVTEDPLATDEDTAGLTSGTDNFKARAMRSGTPLPTSEHAHAESEDNDDDDVDGYDPESDEDSDVTETQLDETSAAPEHRETTQQIDEEELKTLEEIDGKASQLEEHRLMRLLGLLSPATEGDAEGDVMEVKEEEKESHIDKGLRNTGELDWRVWTEYHPEWEEMQSPVPACKFDANKKSPSPGPLPSMEMAMETGVSSDAEGLPSGRRNKRRKVTETELPIRGASEYAALQGAFSGSPEPQLGEGSADDDDAKWPAPSIEDPGPQISRAASHPNDYMDVGFDAKEALGIDSDYMGSDY